MQGFKLVGLGLRSLDYMDRAGFESDWGTQKIVGSIEHYRSRIIIPIVRNYCSHDSIA